MFSKVSLDIAGKTIMGLNMNNLGAEEDPQKRRVKLANAL
jgi:hypothetical protein